MKKVLVILCIVFAFIVFCSCSTEVTSDTTDLSTEDCSADIAKADTCPHVCVDTCKMKK